MTDVDHSGSAAINRVTEDLSAAVIPAERDRISSHVNFYGVGKVARYRQNWDSSLVKLEPLFFAEIFIAAGGTVSSATIKFPEPVNEAIELQYRYSESDAIGDVMYLSGMAQTDR